MPSKNPEDVLWTLVRLLGGGGPGSLSLAQARSSASRREHSSEDASMAEELVLLQRQAIKLYQLHHRDCNVIPEQLRVSLDECYKTLGISDEANVSVTATKSSNTKRKKACTSSTRPSKRKNNWERVAQSMIKRAPSAESWDQKLFGIDFNNSTPGWIESSIAVDVRPNADLPERIRGYARATASSIFKAEHADTAARVHLFFLLSFCVVLNETRLISRDDSNAAMRLTITEGSDAYLARLLNHTKLIHVEVIGGLHQAGWSLSQATLIVALSMHSPTSKRLF